MRQHVHRRLRGILCSLHRWVNVFDNLMLLPHPHAARRLSRAFPSHRSPCWSARPRRELHLTIMASFKHTCHSHGNAFTHFKGTWSKGKWHDCHTQWLGGIFLLPGVLDMLVFKSLKLSTTNLTLSWQKKIRLYSFSCSFECMQAVIKWYLLAI